MDNQKTDIITESRAIRRSTPFEKPSDLIGPALASIPVVGGALGTIWNQWDTNARFARVESFLKDLAQQIEELGSNFNPNNLSNDEMRFLEETIKRIASEHREMKRKRFATLVLSTWTQRKECPFEENMMFIRALDEFEDVHIKMLILLKESDNKFPSFTEIGEKLGILADDRDKILIPAIDRLSSGYGFIKRAWGMSNTEDRGKILNSKNLSPEGIARKCEHTINPIGIDFLNSIIK